MHGNWLHLLVNMMSLWFLGPHVEAGLGTPRFLRFYFICVLGAALTQTIVAPHAMVVGASGGIYGVLLAFGLMYPDTVLYLYFLFPLRAIHSVLFFAALALFSAMGSGGSRIAHFAHLGGMLTGYLYFKFPIWFSFVRNLTFSQFSRQPHFELYQDNPSSPEEPLSSEVDRILDKISSEGLQSLTENEHDIMKRYASTKH